MKNKTYYLIGVLIIIILIILFYFFRYFRTNNSNSNQNTSSSNTTTSNSTQAVPATSTKNSFIPSESTKTTKPIGKKPVSPVVTTKQPLIAAPASQSYMDAFKTYHATGYYFQFYPCQATPGFLTVKKGSKIMLDNRDIITHVISINPNRYTIKPYGFAIATVNTLGTNYVTCDGGGSATINVQP